VKLPIRNWWTEVDRWWRRQTRSERPQVETPPPPGPRSYRRLDRIVLHEGVGQTLFDDFERHRTTERGDEELGWVLLGRREEDHAIAVAALPAGADREASATHIQFNSDAQALACRILRMIDRRIGMLGVVHTHPGSLRHPSSGDYRGDIRWVAGLRGKEGVFGIGTADAHAGRDQVVTPERNRQERGRLTFSWYGLSPGDPTYRRLPIEWTAGVDLARPILPAWPTLERHAVDLERLCVQQTGVRVEVLGPEATLSLTIPLVEPRDRICLLLTGDQVRYCVELGGAMHEVDPKGAGVAHGTYLLLAELAKRGGR
jgi:proteasome lid subunit RPN8/RPN11